MSNKALEADIWHRRPWKVPYWPSEASEASGGSKGGAVCEGGKAGFPRFKGSNRYDSFTLKQCGWKLDGRYLYIRNVGRFKLFLSRPI